MANQPDVDKIKRLNALSGYRNVVTVAVTAFTVSSFKHITDQKLAEQVRWTIEGVYQAWSTREHMAELVASPAGRERLWSQADALWQDYETLLIDWGLGAYIS